VGRQARAIGDRIKAELAKAAKALTLEIAKEARKATPVDTGHARANWVPSVGSPHRGEVNDPSAAQAGAAVVLRYELSQGPLFVSNGVPYIQRLNHGHSKQAPRLFVEAAVDRAHAKIQERYRGRIDVSKGVVQVGAAGVNELGGAMAGNLADAFNPFGGDRP
jgi:hypothetical protein